MRSTPPRGSPPTASRRHTASSFRPGERSRYDGDLGARQLDVDVAVLARQATPANVRPNGLQRIIGGLQLARSFCTADADLGAERRGGEQPAKQSSPRITVPCTTSP